MREVNKKKANDPGPVHNKLKLCIRAPNTCTCIKVFETKKGSIHKILKLL